MRDGPDLPVVAAAPEYMEQKATIEVKRKNWVFKSDNFVKSRKTPFFVIPAQAGIQSFQMVSDGLDSGFHRSDGFLRVHQK